MTQKDNTGTPIQQLLITSTIHASSSIQNSAQAAVGIQGLGPDSSDGDRPMVETAVSLGVTISSILKDVAETSGHIPYVKGIAGVVNQLLQIRQELQAHKKRCNELLEKVLRNGKLIVEQCVMLKGYREEGRLEPFFRQLEAYQSLLEEVYRFLQNVKARGRVHRWFNRGLDEFNELDRKIDSFGNNNNFIGITQILAEMKVPPPVIENESSMPPIGPKAPLPPRPICILERDAQLDEIIAALLSSSNARVAILGMGGIGKTTLACSAMRDPKVIEAYPRHLFISFEGLSTTELAYNSLANIFNIPTESRTSNAQVLEEVKHYLRQERTIICIDNFETFWEISGNRREADNLLGQLVELPTLAIIVTLRGIQTPGEIDWVRLGPLPPLTHTASTGLVHRIARGALGDDDGDVLQNLCEAVAGVPLAVTLIGNLLRDGSETPDSLWHRWNKESTHVIGTDVEDRHYHLEVSLKLSVFGPRMCDESRAVLGMIAVLPAGLSAEDSWLDEVQGLLPSSLRFRDCLRALQNTALCSRERNPTIPRFQLLSPTRQYCIKEIPLDVEPVHRIIDLYTNRLSRNPDHTSSSEYTWFTNELPNITAILNLALSLPYITDSHAYACSSYAKWMIYLGFPTTELVSKATNAHPAGSSAKAACLQSHAYVLARQSQRETSVQLLKEALSIHTDLEDKVEEAWDLLELGDCYRVLGRNEEAVIALTDASKLYQEQGDQLGESNCQISLANLYDDMNQCSEAETSVKRAIELYRAVGDRLGEVNALNLLGWVYTKQGQEELAIRPLEDSIRLSEDIKYTYGQATATRYLGLAHEVGGSLDRALSCFRDAITLFEKCAYSEGGELARKEVLRVLSSIDADAETQT